MVKNEIVAQMPEATVVAQYTPVEQKSTAYQSEADLEQELITQLQAQGYAYAAIHNEEEALRNLREQLSLLNNIVFTDTEWQRFIKEEIEKHQGIEEKTRILQTDSTRLLTRDDGTTKNIRLLNKDDIHANRLQVINQYETKAGNHANRYDVTILVNGLPMVHIELKRRGVSIQEAFNQIERYQRDSFWSGRGLFEFVQLFVISNGTQTKYYSNTTRLGHIHTLSNGKRKAQTTSNSWEFTSWWADATNTPIEDLVDFTRTFLTRHTLIRMLTRYCIFNTDKMLMVMRPYQVVAAERILNQVEVAHANHMAGQLSAGGYIWHTTGSGKTLTSFKTAQLVSALPYIQKVLFVVDRQDLDYQTMREYNRFEEHAANGSIDTRALERNLNDPNKHILVTTIQKLSNLIKLYQRNGTRHPLFNEEVVFIFDECHRSQFGQMHQAIIRTFKKYYLFGFTGTPIFESEKHESVVQIAQKISARRTQQTALETTEDTFGARLHAYTIVDAIRDNNVLPFRVDYVRTMRLKDDAQTTQVYDIDRAEAFTDEKRIQNIVRYILEKFDTKTRRSKSYEFRVTENISELAAASPRDAHKVVERKNGRHIMGFNSIFATASVEMAYTYYREFRRQQADVASPLKVAMIYSYGANDDAEAYQQQLADSAWNDPSGILNDENSDTTLGLPADAREALDEAIRDYNAYFGTEYSTESDKFPAYYKDVSLRMKNRQLDILIVVNMFLTGFDATTLNTLWVDKNLRRHGLLQAFSRTNRILNSVKPFGNIICFRNLEDATNDALALYGDRNAHSVALIHTFEEYYFNGYEEHGQHCMSYMQTVTLLQEEFPLTGTKAITAAILLGDPQRAKDFIVLFSYFLQCYNILLSFDEFTDADSNTGPLFFERAMQDYIGIYLELHEAVKRGRIAASEDGQEHLAERGEMEAITELTSITEDLEFEMELIRQVEVNIAYILFLVKKWHDSNMPEKDKLIFELQQIMKASPTLRDKVTLIEQFIDRLTPQSDVDTEWRQFIEEQREEALQQIIAEEDLIAEKTEALMQTAFREDGVPEVGTAIKDIIRPMHPFARSASGASLYEEKRATVLSKLKALFTRFHDMIAYRDED